MGELKRRAPSSAFEPDDGKRLKRFRWMLLNDCKKDAVFNVDGERVPVHHELLVASSPVLSLLGRNIPITGTSVEAVRHFVGYLYGFNVFEDGELSMDEALELADLSIQFDISAAAMKAARYCLQKSAPVHLNKICRVLGKVKEIRGELAKKIVDNHDCVDMALVDKSTMYLVLTSLRLTELQKLVAVGKWTKANSKNGLMQQLLGTIDLSYAGQSLKGMEERLRRKDERINVLQGKLRKEEESNETLWVQLKEAQENTGTMTATAKERANEKVVVQPSNVIELSARKSALALSRSSAQTPKDPRLNLESTSRIAQVNHYTTPVTDRNSTEPLRIPPKKRILEPEIDNDKTNTFNSTSLEKDTSSLSAKEPASDSIEHQNNEGHDLPVQRDEESLSKNGSQMDSQAKEIVFVQAVPHCYEVTLSSSSSSEESRDDSFTGNTITATENEQRTIESDDDDEIQSQEEYENTFEELDGIQTANRENDSAGRNTNTDMIVTEGSDVGLIDKRLPYVIVEEATSLSEYVTKMQMDWIHPDGGQPETMMLHQVRAIIKLRSMSQKSFAKEAGISQSSASLYLRGKHKGNVHKVEEKLEQFVQKYLDIMIGEEQIAFLDKVSAPNSIEIPGMGSQEKEGENEEERGRSKGQSLEKQRDRTEISNIGVTATMPREGSQEKEGEKEGRRNRDESLEKEQDKTEIGNVGVIGTMLAVGVAEKGGEKEEEGEEENRNGSLRKKLGRTETTEIGVTGTIGPQEKEEERVGNKDESLGKEQDRTEIHKIGVTGTMPPLPSPSFVPRPPSPSRKSSKVCTQPPRSTLYHHPSSSPPDKPSEI